MLADPSSKSLVTNFADQWLTVDEMDAHRARSDAVPGIRRRRCARPSGTRGELFVDSVLSEDQSVMNLLTRTTRSSTSGSRCTTAFRTSAAIGSAA